MHHQHAARIATPIRDHRRAAPGRGGLDHVGPQPVERGMDLGGIGEIAVAAVEREARAGEPFDPRAVAALLDAILAAGARMIISCPAAGAAFSLRST